MILWLSNHPSRCLGRKKHITGKTKREKRNVGIEVTQQKGVQSICFILCCVQIWSSSYFMICYVLQSTAEREENKILAKSINLLQIILNRYFIFLLVCFPLAALFWGSWSVYKIVLIQCGKATLQCSIAFKKHMLDKVQVVGLLSPHYQELLRGVGKMNHNVMQKLKEVNLCLVFFKSDDFFKIMRLMQPNITAYLIQKIKKRRQRPQFCSVIITLFLFFS